MSSLLQLIMIVKNAEISIKETLESYKPYVSHWYILDTGSTDNTIEIIKETMKDIPGTVGIETFNPFSFAKARNRAVELAKKENKDKGYSPMYYIMPDDSYILYGGSNLLNVLEKATKIEEGVLGIKIKGPDAEYYRNLIVKMDYDHKYEGDVHADVTHRGKIASIIDDKIFLIDKFYKEAYDRSLERWYKDIESLTNDYVSRPNEPRASFYLGQTYYGLSEDPKAKDKKDHNIQKSIDFFKIRVDYNDNYYEERFIAYLNLGKLYWSTTSDMALSFPYFNQAIMTFPNRAAEALFEVAKCYDQQSNLLKEQLELINQGINPLPTPDDKAFTSEKDLLEYKRKHIQEQISMAEKMTYIYVSEASNYRIHQDCVLFMDTKVYKKFIPMMCTIYAIRRNNNELAYLQIEKLRETLKDPFYKDDKDIINFIQEINIESLIHLGTKQQQKQQIIPVKDKERVVFVTGQYWYSWNTETSLKKGSESLGGSEYMLKIQAEYLATQGFEVHVFVHCDKEHQGLFNNVNWHSNNEFKSYVDTNEINYCVVSRHADYLRALKDMPHIHNVYLWVHDVFPQSSIICDPKNFRKFIVLSPWQKQMIKGSYKVQEELLTILDNCIMKVPKTPIPLSQKKKMSFIYSSSIERGLILVVDIMPRIREKFPDATLTVCCDLISKNSDSSSSSSQEKVNSYIAKKIFEYKDFITYKGRLDREELYEEFTKAEFFLYPSIFAETFCISALEAQAYGAIPICNKLAALETTVGPRGLLIDIPNNESSLSVDRISKEIISFLKQLEKSPQKAQELRTMGHEYALEHTIDKIGPKLISIFENKGPGQNEKVL